MSLYRRKEPFDHSDWVFEIKHDGFRGLAYVDAEHARLLSRRGNSYKSFGELSGWIGRHLRVENAVIDGEIACLDSEGRSHFGDLLYRRSDPYFFAFDLLWLDGRDLRDLPLVERKQKLREIVPAAPSRMLFSDSLETRGTQLYRFASEYDLEGIVAKWKFGSYLPNSTATTWIKIKNPAYTQAEGRGDFFDSQTIRNSNSAADVRLLEPELLGIK
jgi:bifunctional non-homologous end joining protein LigD